MSAIGSSSIGQSSTNDHAAGGLPLSSSRPSGITSSSSSSSENNLWTTSQKNLDTMLAQELSKLSMEERSQAEYDIHGVAEEVKETPQMISQSLGELQEILSRMIHTDESSVSLPPKTTITPYEKALSQNADFVQDSALRLKFLRAERFQVQGAADRMFRFFALKEELFGTEKLTKEITIQDLDPEDQECLKSGICQILPFPDRAGRLVLFWNTCLRGNSSLQSRMRTNYYMYMAASRDEDCQRKGMVIVIMNFGQKGNSKEIKAANRLPAMLSCYPVRFDAMHTCVDPLTVEEKKAYHSLVVARSGDRVRIRARRHEGMHCRILFIYLATMTLILTLCMSCSHRHL